MPQRDWIFLAADTRAARHWVNVVDDRPTPTSHRAHVAAAGS
jgi:hypothetical protein